MIKTTAAALLLAVLSLPMSSQEKSLLTPETLWQMARLGATAVSPDGRRVAYAATTYSVQKNKSHTALYIMNSDGTGLSLLTPGETSESDPAFIDGGRHLAYLSGGDVWRMNLDGTARQRLTSGGGVGGFLFSADSRRVVLVRDVAATSSIAPKEDDLPLATGLVINDMNYKHWDHYVVDIPHPFLSTYDGQRISGEKDILEGEPYECPMLPFGGMEEFAFSPDGQSLAYTCRKKTGVDYASSTDADIYLYHIPTGQTTNLCKPAGYREPASDNLLSRQHQPKNSATGDINAGYDQDPQFSPDGRLLAWKSMERDGYESDRVRLLVLDLQTGRKTYTTEAFESNVEAFAWGADSRTLYFSGVWHARAMVYATGLDGRVRPLTDGDYDYTLRALMPSGRQLLASRHSLSAPDDLYLLTLKDGRVEPLTNINQSILDTLDFGQVKERWVGTTDGKRELCWVVYPPHFDPSKRYPALLFCEGGPQSPVSQFWSYRWNLQIMAANGYIVIAPNRRGLPGFGMEWLEEISGDYSGQCMDDYLSAIDDLCREPYVDRARLGCVGASFGGYSVYWLAGHHDKRFKAFIAHDGIFNTQQQYVETEEMWFPNWDLGGSPDRLPQAKAFTESPHLYVDRWDTPILCIHGEKDYRILASQGQSAFSAARMHGLPAQLLLYPDENHWVLKPQNGILWQRTFFRWLDRWLSGGER